MRRRISPALSVIALCLLLGIARAARLGPLREGPPRRRVPATFRGPPPPLLRKAGAPPWAPLRGPRRVPRDVARHVLGFLARPRQVAASDGDAGVLLWTVGALAPPAALDVLPGGGVVDLRFFPSGDRLVTAHADGTAAIWSTVSAGRLCELRGHAPGAALFEVQVFPRGDRVVSVGSDGAAVVWRAGDGELLQRLRQPRGVDRRRAYRRVRVLPGGDRVVVGVSPMDTAVVWRVGAGRVACTLAQGTGAVLALDVSADGRSILTASRRGVYLWRSEDGRLERPRLLASRHPFGRFTGAVFGGTGRKVVAMTSSSVVVWDARAGTSAAARVRGEVRGVAAAPGGDLAVVVTRHAATRVDTATGHSLGRLVGSWQLERVAVSPAGDFVAGCGSNAPPRATVWNTSTGEQEQVLQVREVPPPRRLPCRVAVGAGWPSAD